MSKEADGWIEQEITLDEMEESGDNLLGRGFVILK